MLSERIRQLRTNKGLTQQGLADSLGISQQAVGRWERNLASPDISTLPKLAVLFDVSIDHLLGRDKPAAQPLSPADQALVDKIKDLPERDRQIVEAIIQLNEQKKDSSAAAGN